MYCPSCGHLNLPGADQCGKCLLDLAALDRPAAHDKVEASLMADPVSVLHPKPPVTVPAAAALGDAVRVMMDRGVGAVLVTAADGGLVGILTERDFLTKVAGQPGFEHLPVDRFMTPRPETVAADDPLALALQKMDIGGYRHLPVVAGGVPVGVVSVRDVLRHVTRLCKEP
jgi:CBS domain-containing protein